ncbi:Signal transducer CD24 [Manis javanica]|nr:Signal transducer CD24 [Manis javanica]
MGRAMVARLGLGLLLLALLLPSQIFSDQTTIGTLSSNLSQSQSSSTPPNPANVTTKAADGALQSTASLFVLSFSLLPSRTVVHSWLGCLRTWKDTGEVEAESPNPANIFANSSFIRLTSDKAFGASRPCLLQELCVCLIPKVKVKESAWKCDNIHSGRLGFASSFLKPQKKTTQSPAPCFCWCSSFEALFPVAQNSPETFVQEPSVPRE